jgi:hypothetical protein
MNFQASIKRALKDESNAKWCFKLKQKKFANKRKKKLNIHVKILR